jgi:hypothetical protein
LHPKEAAQFGQRGVGMLLHQGRQLVAIHDGDSGSSHPPMSGFARLASALLDPTRPGWADVEDDSDLLGLHPAVVGLKNSVAQIL